MRRLLVPLGLLLGSCNADETSEITFPAGQLTEFILRLNHGAVIVRNPIGDEKPDLCVVRVKESGVSKPLGAKERFNANVTKERVRLRHRRNEPGLRLDTLVIVPKDVNIDIVINEGGIRAEGTFGLMSLTCKDGDVIADPVRTAGGALKTLRGNVTLVLENPKIESNLTCETLEGDASLRIPLAYLGPIILESASAQLDFGKDPKMLFLLNPDKTSARRLMSPEQREKAKLSGRTSAGIWGKTSKGKVVLRQSTPPKSAPPKK